LSRSRQPSGTRVTRNRQDVAANDIEQPLRAVLEGVSALTGEDFFRSAARQLAVALQVRLAFVAEIADSKRTRARTLAFWNGDGLGENFEYDLSGTPCENVVGNRLCYYPSNVQKTFPEDRGLARMGIESYVGIPVLGSEGKVVGHLAALDVEPLETRLSPEWVLKIFAARTGAEIERRRAEIASREGERRYALATKAAKVGVWDWNLHTGRFYLDPNVKEILGYNDDEIPNDLEEWSKHIHPEDHPMVAEEIEAHLRSSETEYVCEHRMVHRDGSERWIAARGTTIRDDDGNAVRLVGTDSDITERKLMEERLRESEERFRATFEQANVGIAHVGTDGYWLRVNEEVCKILGYDREELARLTFEEITHPDDLEPGLQFVHGALEGKADAFGMEKRYIRKDGTPVWANVTRRLLRTETGEPKYFISVIEDISERKQAEEERQKLEEQLRQSQKLESLGVLAGGIAHDFNNLLMGMLGNASLAVQELPADSGIRGRIQSIETAALKAADLTRQLLAYAGKASFSVQAIDLNDTIMEMAPLLETVVTKKAMFRYNLADDLPAIEGDSSQIAQVVMNLLTNASDALGEDAGIITLSTGVFEADRAYLMDTQSGEDLPAGTYAYVEVSDTGAGMDEETRGRIFDPFFTTKFIGRGLGLAAVLGIVRGHRGAISVGTRQGDGTTLRVLFPVGARQVEKTAEPEGEHKTLVGTGTIMVVDDEETVREAARAMLESQGFDVIEARDGVEAVEVMRAHPESIRAVLLDMTMPRLDGEKTFFALHGMNPNAPVILMSGYDEQEVTRRLAGRGLAGFLHKPFRTSDLIDRLRDVLGTHED
jgi:PAS domain S-box-containing protein